MTECERGAHGHDLIRPAAWTLTQKQPNGHIVEAHVCGQHVHGMLDSLLRGLVDEPVEVTRVRPRPGATL